MDSELINRVKEVLINPHSSIKKLNELRDLCFELCNKHTVNIKCSDCIREGMMLLTNWIKINNIDIDYKASLNKALMGEYEFKPINLFVQVYKSDNEARQKELDDCYAINHRSKLFNKVLTITERLTFEQMFELSKQYPNDINVFANSDIYFDETILHARYMSKNDCWALSRWDDLNDKCVLFDRKDSQDVWAFVGEVKKLNYASFNFGVAGCDNRIAHELKSAGYRVLNPSKNVHALHLHNTNFRTYDANDKVPMPYHFIHPNYL